MLSKITSILLLSALLLLSGAGAQRPSNTRQPSGTGRTSIRQPSGTGGTSIRQPSGTGRTSIRQPSKTGGTSIRQPSGTGRTSIRQPSVTSSTNYEDVKKQVRLELFTDERLSSTLSKKNGKFKEKKGKIIMTSKTSFALQACTDPLRAKVIYNIKELDLSKKTKVVMHGYGSSGEQSKQNGWLEAYAGKGVNLIIVDWGSLAAIYGGAWDITNLDVPNAYINSAENAIRVGKFLATCLTNLGVQGDQLHLFGHSLGAQGVGATGRKMAQIQTKPDRVTGMDPAGPNFVEGYSWCHPPSQERDRISRSSGVFVDIVHTNVGYLGDKDTLGHVDYYVNGGGPLQKPCINTAGYTNIMNMVIPNSIRGYDISSHSYAVKVVVASIKEIKQDVYQCTLSEPFPTNFDTQEYCPKTSRRTPLLFNYGAENPKPKANQGEMFYIRTKVSC